MTLKRTNCFDPLLWICDVFLLCLSFTRNYKNTSLTFWKKKIFLFHVNSFQCQTWFLPCIYITHCILFIQLQLLPYLDLTWKYLQLEVITGSSDKLQTTLWCKKVVNIVFLHFWSILTKNSCMILLWHKLL